MSQNDEYNDTSARISIFVIAFVIVVITLAVLVIHLHSQNTTQNIQTDMIAACTASNDVVGCLEALSD